MNILTFFVILLIFMALIFQTRAQGHNHVPKVCTFKIGQQRCPAKSFYINCNRCNCDNNGIACTNKRCSPCEDATTETIPRVCNYRQGDKCPAKQFYDNCNRCTCNPDSRTVACTLMACPEPCKAS